MCAQAVGWCPHIKAEEVTGSTPCCAPSTPPSSPPHGLALTTQGGVLMRLLLMGVLGSHQPTGYQNEHFQNPSKQVQGPLASHPCPFRYDHPIPHRALEFSYGYQSRPHG